MKISAFHVKDGDCVLIRGDDDTVILADGGRSTSFEKHVAPELTKEKLKTDIDLVYVSHIDNDHISGVLKLIQASIGWEVFDFHENETDFTGSPPTLPRPASIKTIWHNGFVELIDDQSGKIQKALELATRALALNTNAVDLFELYDNLVTGVAATLELNYRLEFSGKLGILNPESKRADKLMLLSSKKEKHTVGEFEVFVLGPTVKALEELRDYWNDWLDDHDLDVPEIRRMAEEESKTTGVQEEEALLRLLLGEASSLGEGTEGVSEPNVASLALLLEDGNHKILLTGDARSEELLSGLRKHKLITKKKGIHVDVLKVQHHGAAGNVTEEFCKFVTADHYIFCANGANTNPEKVVLDGFLDYRVGDKASASVSPVKKDRKFTFWFTTESTTKGITKKQKKYLKSVEKHLKDNWDDEPTFTRKYPDANVDPFSISFEL